MVLRVNDENARPSRGPNDTDRARFGFGKRLSSCPRRTSQAPTPPAAARGEEPEEELSVLAGPAVAEPVALLPLLERALGTPDADIHLLRVKPAATKYDFKGRIAELSEQNRALRQALADRREGQRGLAESLAQAQADINYQLRLGASAREQLEERGRLVDVLQEAVRTVWREEAAGGPGAEAQRCSQLEAQLEALRQCCAAEASRAAGAEALARRREQELLAARAELRRSGEALAAQVWAADGRAELATQLVREAGRLLQAQQEEASRRHQEVVSLTGAREAELAAELSAAASRVELLEARLAAAGGAEPEAEADAEARPPASPAAGGMARRGPTPAREEAP